VKESLCQRTLHCKKEPVSLENPLQPKRGGAGQTPKILPGSNVTPQRWIVSNPLSGWRNAAGYKRTAGINSTRASDPIHCIVYFHPGTLDKRSG
jgi:hypothetical protein